MSNSEPKVGQTWRSKDGGASFKIQKIGTQRAWGANPDGSRPRGVLLSALAKDGRRGWELIEDAP